MTAQSGLVAVLSSNREDLLVPGRRRGAPRACIFRRADDNVGGSSRTGSKLARANPRLARCVCEMAGK